MVICMKIVKRLFRYRLTAIFMMIGQIIVLFTIFGALGVYNKAYNKENDRLRSLYKNVIQMQITTSKKTDVISGISSDVEQCNLIIKKKFSVAIAELGKACLCEVILKDNESLKYPLLSGRLPGTKKNNEIAVGKNKAKIAIKQGDDLFLTIEGEKYKIVGIIGSEVSDYWDDKLVLHMDSIGDNVKKALTKQVSYSVELCSDSDIEEKTYSTVYGNIKSYDGDSVIEAVKINSDNDSVLEQTLAKENLKINVIAYCFCILNCMVVSEFWILQRRKEYAIKKLLGMGDMRLIIDMMREIIEISLLSCCAFLVIYMVIGICGGADISITTRNILLVVGAEFAAVLGTMLYPIYKVLKNKESFKYI